MLSSLFLVAAGFASIAAAQSTTLPATVSIMSSALTDISAAVTATSMLVTGTASDSAPSAGATNYGINPGAINATEAVQWCGAQQNSCFQICNMDPMTNTCESTTLEWACTCATGKTPNLANFNQTIPYFECITYVANCVAATDNAQAQRNCMQTKCGGPVLPIDYNGASTTSTTTTGTSTGSDAGASATSASASDGGNAASALHAAENVGFSVFAFVGAAFGLLL